jgi:hypothetical protein
MQHDSIDFISMHCSAWQLENEILEFKNSKVLSRQMLTPYKIALLCVYKEAMRLHGLSEPFLELILFLHKELEVAYFRAANEVTECHQRVRVHACST